MPAKKETGEAPEVPEKQMNYNMMKGKLSVWVTDAIGSDLTIAPPEPVVADVPAESLFPGNSVPGRMQDL